MYVCMYICMYAIRGKAVPTRSIIIRQSVGTPQCGLMPTIVGIYGYTLSRKPASFSTEGARAEGEGNLLPKKRLGRLRYTLHLALLPACFSSLQPWQKKIKLL